MSVGVRGCESVRLKIESVLHIAEYMVEIGELPSISTFYDQLLSIFTFLYVIPNLRSEPKSSHIVLPNIAYSKTLIIFNPHHRNSTIHTTTHLYKVHLMIIEPPKNINSLLIIHPSCTSISRNALIPHFFVNIFVSMIKRAESLKLVPCGLLGIVGRIFRKKLF